MPPTRALPTSLSTLISSDGRFQDTSLALDAYAESWALTYFLLKRYPREYVSYLEALSKKDVLVEDDAPTRLKQFREAFGEDLRALDGEFVRYMMTLR